MRIRVHRTLWRAHNVLWPGFFSCRVPPLFLFSLSSPSYFFIRSLFPTSSGDRLPVQASRCIARRTTTPTTSLRFRSVANRRGFPFKKKKGTGGAPETKDALESPTPVRQRSGCPRATHGKKRAFNFVALEARFVSFRQHAHFVVSIIDFYFFFLFFLTLSCDEGRDGRLGSTHALVDSVQKGVGARAPLSALLWR